jgi:hypothetical protein
MEYTPVNQLSEQSKYLILLAAFTAYVMKVENCDQPEATRRTAQMCALTQTCLDIR